MEATGAGAAGEEGVTELPTEARGFSLSESVADPASEAAVEAAGAAEGVSTTAFTGAAVTGAGAATAAGDSGGRAAGGASGRARGFSRRVGVLSSLMISFAVYRLSRCRWPEGASGKKERCE